ncbi:hypothetical protein BJX62DRAFT_205162 [Aspergillus germanicus]
MYDYPSGSHELLMCPLVSHTKSRTARTLVQLLAHICMIDILLITRGHGYRIGGCICRKSAMFCSCWIYCFVSFLYPCYTSLVS